MVNRCCVGNCSNTLSPDISLFRFPRDEAVKKQWIEQVKRTRERWHGPGLHSMVCSAHFTEGSFDPVTKLRAELGWKQQKPRKLLPEAVPTIFTRKSDEARAQRGTSPPPPKRIRTAFLKREKHRVSKQMYA